MSGLKKSASGQNVVGVETRQQNPVVSDGMHREKVVPVGVDAPDEIVVENNALSLSKGMADYGMAQTSRGTTLVQRGVSSEEVAASLDKATKGDLPDGVNITKVIVDGYVDGALITGAWYIGPAATAGKVVGGAIIAEIANGTYQWFDLSQPGNENKSWDYTSSFTAGVTGALAPGRGIWVNTGIASGSAIFSDGLDPAAIGGSAAGTLAGGAFGKYAPDVLNKVIGKELPGLIYDIGGAFTYETINDVSKDAFKKQEEGKK